MNANIKTTIAGKVLIVEEWPYPPHRFEIVDKPPYGYEIWNIGEHMPEGWTLYVKTGGYDGKQVDIYSMKAVKHENDNL